MTTIAEAGPEMKLEDAVEKLLLRFQYMPIDVQTRMAPVVNDVSVCLARRRSQSRAPGGRIVIGMKVDHAVELYQELGKHSIYEDWAREIWNSLHRGMECE